MIGAPTIFDARSSRCDSDSLTKSAMQTPPKPSRAGTRNRETPAGDPLSNTLAFMRLLWAMDHGLRSISKRMQTRLGVTAPQRLVLRLLGREPGMTPSALAALLHLDRGTLTGIVERLELQALLVRRPHPEDRRSFVLSLTRQGKRLDREAEGTVEACVRRALESLPKAKVDAAREVLERIARELEQGPAPR
jgi:MarR family transcriptional regulator, organic hydroperoxide resistance regulator